MARTVVARTEDGIDLALDAIEAEGRPRGAVWLGHAILANRRSLDRPSGEGLASELARAGLHAYAADWRGHGASPAPEGEWTYEDLIRYDFPAVTRLLRERHPGLPVAAVGHSLTGHAAAAWIGLETGRRGRAPVEALVTIGANVWLPRLEPSRARWARKRAVLALMGGIRRVFGRLPARAARFGSDDLPGEFTDQWLEWARRDRWVSRDGRDDYLAALGSVRIPVLGVLGSGDAILCHPACGELFHRRLSAAPVTLWVAGESDLGYAPGHMELVTDPRSRPLWRRIAAWLAARLGGGGEGGDGA